MSFSVDNAKKTQTGTGDGGSKFEHYTLYDGLQENCYDPEKILIINRFKSSLLKSQIEGLEIWKYLEKKRKCRRGKKKIYITINPRCSSILNRVYGAGVYLSETRKRYDKR